MANDYLAQVANAGFSIDDLASKIRLNFAVGMDYFMENCQGESSKVPYLTKDVKE